jgi:hypothetical protein
MKRLALLSLLVLGCSTSTGENPTPDFDGGAHTNGGGHSLPHALPCHVTTPATETQGQGGYIDQCVAIQ